MATTAAETAAPRPQRIGELLAAMEDGVEERHEAIRLGFLATVAGESIFFLGPPGVAKSLVARRIKYGFQGARSFEYLMGRFSTPEEIFGPISIQRLKNDDTYERITRNYLPDADIVFLDEIWKAGPPIQNALLTALNERTFRNGSREVHIPMKGLLAAANELPEDDATVQAFWDRFLLRLELKPVQDDEAFRRMLLDVEDAYRDPVPEPTKVREEEFAEWQRALSSVRTPEPILSALSHLRHRLAAVNREREESGSSPIYISDRRWKKAMRVLRASAFLNGRDYIDLLDLLLLQHCLWNTRAHRSEIRRLLEEALAHARPNEAIHPRRVAAALGSLRREMHAALVEHGEERRQEAVPYRREYVRIQEYSDAELALLWHGDLEALQDRQADSDTGWEPIEIFLYDADGELEETIRTEARLEGWRLAFSDQADDSAAQTSYPVETRERVDTVAVVRSPSDEERREWLHRLQKMDADARSAIQTAETARQQAHDEAATHLFVHRSYAESAYASLDSAAGQLRRLREAIAKTQSEIDIEP